MIPWKRTLGWTLCWAVASAAVAAEEPAGGSSARCRIPLRRGAAPAEAPAASRSRATPDPLPWPRERAGARGGSARRDPAASGRPRGRPAPAPAELGAVAYDSQGHQGRIHIVVRGDTLWAISNTYLATPWVWPSIWKDNGDIKNPHRIYPG